MDFVDELRKINPDKLAELCRMHLTFTLDLQNDQFEALLCNKNDARNKKSYFYRRHREKNSSDVLNQDNISQMYQIIEFLGRDSSIIEEGLFRKTGSLLRQQELKGLLLAGATINFSVGHYSIHDCASVIKTFLSELPEPLLTESHYSAHCQIADMSSDLMPPSRKTRVFQRQLKAVRLLLLLLPECNYCLLKYVLLLLSQVRNAHEANRMTSKNLATIFAPLILCPKKMSAEELKMNFMRMVKAVEFLIENAMLIFEPPSELIDDIILYLKNLSVQGKLRCVEQTEPVRTTVAFCERTNTDDQTVADYTNKALAELQEYVQNLPNSTRKRKLMKMFHNENTVENLTEERRHRRSKSVCESMKRYLSKPSKREKESFHKNYHHASYDVISSSKSSSNLHVASASKAKSLDGLDVEQSPKLKTNQGSKFGNFGKHWLRASKKFKAW